MLYARYHLMTRSARASTFGGIVSADLLGRFQVDDELELLRLFHRQIGWLGTLEDFVHVCGRAAVQVGRVHAVRHKPASFHKCYGVVYGRELALYREFWNLCSLRTGDAARQQHKDRVSASLDDAIGGFILGDKR